MGDGRDNSRGNPVDNNSRPSRSNDTRRGNGGGGIVLIIRDTFKFTKSKLSSPDILVLDMGIVWLIGAYIPPETSPWEGWNDVTPLQKLSEIIAMCSQRALKPIVLLTDIDARTGSLQASLRGAEWAELWKRISADSDTEINTRGRIVIQECDLYDLCILNGTSRETSSPGRYTSWQMAGESVIDYAIVSASLPLVQEFHVELPTDTISALADRAVNFMPNSQIQLNLCSYHLRPIHTVLMGELIYLNMECWKPAIKITVCHEVSSAIIYT